MNLSRRRRLNFRFKGADKGSELQRWSPGTGSGDGIVEAIVMVWMVEVGGRQRRAAQ